MRIWRICREPYAAFSGEGARRFGGRWNSRGVPMVYASTSLALAAIELFVHLEPGQAPGDLVYISAILPEGEPARTLQPAELPPAWWTGNAAAGASAARSDIDESMDPIVRARASPRGFMDRIAQTAGFQPCMNSMHSLPIFGHVYPYDL